MAQAVTKEVTGRLVRVDRQPSSYYGNPRYLLVLSPDSGSTAEYRTGIDASVGYEVTNFRIGRKVTLTLSGRSESVVGMTYA